MQLTSSKTVFVFYIYMILLFIEISRSSLAHILEKNMFFTKVITILKINDALKRDQIHVFLEVMLVIDFF